MQITFDVIGGRATIEGDIDIGPAERIPATLPDRHSGRNGVRGPSYATLINPFYGGVSRRWPNGIIPYVLPTSLPNRLAVQEAILHVEANAPGVDFRPATQWDVDLVEFKQWSERMCRSAVGRTGGRQYVELNSACDRGLVIHELTHLLGMGHEHNRCDRNKYIQIQWVNIDPANWNQLVRDDQVRCAMGFSDVGPYDLASVTHYSAELLAKSGTKAFVSLIGSDWLMGQRNALSKGDVSALSRYYPGTVPIHRLYNLAWRDHLYSHSSTEGVQFGFKLEAQNYFYLSRAKGIDYATVYRCYVNNKHYLSLRSTCGVGVNAEAVMGTLAISPLEGTVPLYQTRDPRTNDRLATTDPGERQTTLNWGWVDEGRLGYVWPRR